MMMMMINKNKMSVDVFFFNDFKIYFVPVEILRKFLVSYSLIN